MPRRKHFYGLSHLHFLKAHVHSKLDCPHNELPRGDWQRWPISRMPKKPPALSFRAVAGDEESRRPCVCRARFLASPWTVQSRVSLGMSRLGVFTGVFQHPVRAVGRPQSSSAFLIDRYARIDSRVGVVNKDAFESESKKLLHELFGAGARRSRHSGRDARATSMRDFGRPSLSRPSEQGASEKVGSAPRHVRR